MIKFEEHDDNLFRMLEEPVPLTDDAELPVLVRLIQDDTMLGKANKRSYHPDTLAEKIICSSSKLTDDGLFMDGNYTYCYEIIGTLVEEGSADWALYQMMQGEKVFRVEWECDMYCQYTNNEIITFRDGISSTINPVEEWIANAKRADFGWQIYHEPKEEPPKEPDYVICKRYGGNQSVPNPDVFNTAYYATCPKCCGTGYEIKECCGTPNPESATQTSLPVSDATQYKVGDWVEHKESKEQATIRRIMSYGAIEIEFAYSTESDIYQANDFHNDFRKLSPSEIIVRIGCLSGTVVHSLSEDCFLLAKVNDPQHRASCIDMSMLDTETRSLVESLLKAQEEEGK